MLKLKTVCITSLWFLRCFYESLIPARSTEKAKSTTAPHSPALHSTASLAKYPVYLVFLK